VIKKYCFLFVFSLCGLSFCGYGCFRGISVPPVVERLAEQQPLEEDKFQIRNCQVNGDTANTVSPIRISPSQTLLLEGEIASGKWDMNRIIQTWRTDREGGGYSMTGPSRPPKPIELLLRLHGDDVRKESGVIDGRYVESRKASKTSTQLEFRVSVEAPARPGKYVIDITAFDLMLPNLMISDDPDDLGGTAIWRRELVVE